MKVSLVYRGPHIYALFMKFLYGKNYKARYKTIAEEIPEGASVLDLCCGDCALYEYELKGKASYSGVDINPYFITNAKNLSINAILADVSKDELPNSDYVVMQGGLCQFIPNHKEIVDKLLRVASNKVIISEPVRNLSTSKNPVISFIAKRSADPGTGHKTERFTESTFTEFFDNNYGKLIEKFKPIPGGRDLIVVLNSKKNL